ncbi:hypothetical protein Lqui_0642 [Legionella quinlivanii]|uniref:Uncharacterized protein n=1 Tax=Legionella quinlivanii TaxID=45073 RepID=A0A0W0Y561_9GAMM|nr:hypothetical protein Lqui_0642 [Legionella quinlivanii]
MFGTEGGTRTHTVSPPPDFESGASTNSATPARETDYNKEIFGNNASCKNISKNKPLICYLSANGGLPGKTCYFLLQ